MFSVDQLAILELQLGTNTLMLVPNFRSSRQLQDQLAGYRSAQSGKTVQAALPILAIDLWLSDLWQQLALHSSHTQLQSHILTPEQEALLWQRVIAESALGSTLLNISGTADSAREAWQLMQQWLLPDDFLHKLTSSQQLDPKLSATEIFADWAWRFGELCRQKHSLSFSSMLAALVTLLADGTTNWRTLLPDKLLLWGFSEPPPLYRKLFDTLSTLGINIEELEQTDCQPEQSLKAYAQVNDEIAAAAAWAHDILAKQPDACIGIICADLHAILPAVEQIFARTFPAAGNKRYLCTAPQALSASGFISTAIRLLQAHEETCNTLTLCQLLRSPWLQAHDSENDARAQLELRLREQGEIRTQMSDFRSWCLQENSTCYSPVLGKALLEFHTRLLRAPASAPAQFWFRLFIDYWQQTLNTQALHFVDSKPLLKGWQALQEQLLLSDFLYEECSLGKALSIVNALVNKMHIPEMMQTASVMIMNPVASAGMSFTHRWSLQMNEQFWPADRSPNPFLAIRLQKHHQLPNSEPALALQQALALLQSQRAATRTELVYSYALNDDDLELKPSRLLPQLLPQFIAAAEYPALLHPDLSHYPKGQTLGDNESLLLPLPLTTEVNGGSSLLTHQAQCPFRAFAITRLHATELKALRYGLPATAVGSCVHLILELFWNAFSSSTALAALAPAKLETHIQECVAQALKQTAKHYPYTMTPRFIALEQQRLSALLQQWLEEEHKRGSFQKLNAEQRFVWKYSRMKLNLRIDRIDSDAAGNSVIVDYKTGRPKSLDWEAQRQEEPQLMLYLQAVEQSAAFKPVSALLYAYVNVENPRYDGIGISNDVHPGIALADKQYLQSSDWNALKRYWETSLQALAQEFLDGYVAVAPLKSTTCNYCHLQSLCRIGELRSSYAVDESDLDEARVIQP